MTGLSNRGDPLLEDIRSAVGEGYFDRQAEQDPSELASTPVEELLQRVAMMSPAYRRKYLADIGGLRADGTRTLSGEQKTNRPIARWLSKRR